jgi:hypothetical protein
MKIKDVKRGDTRNIDVTFYQSDGVTPYDITGGTVFFTVNSSSAPADDLAAAISKNVTSHTEPTSGRSRIALTPSDTNITPGTYYYDVQLKDANGNILSSKQDKFVVLADVTRRTT